MSQLMSELFQAPARTAVLSLLLKAGLIVSMRELALRSGLSYPAVKNEVDHLERLGLVTTTPAGAARRVSANWDHPACRPLKALLTLDAPLERVVNETTVRESLVAYGAPLRGSHAKAHWSLEETVVSALQEARRNATVMRVLPVVLAKNRHRLDRQALLELARKHKVKAELGMLLELTGHLVRDAMLLAVAEELHDRRSLRLREFPEAKNRYDAELAAQNHFPVAERWLLRTSMTEDSFRDLLHKHCPELMHA